MDDKIKEVMGLVNNIISSDNTSYQFDCRNEIESKLREMVPAWLPIESAPKDGTEILLLTNRGVREAFWEAEWLSSGSCWESETHWMPLLKEPS